MNNYQYDNITDFIYDVKICSLRKEYIDYLTFNDYLTIIQKLISCE